jgi:transcriptional regulator GlxA family with amidase domain
MMCQTRQNWLIEMANRFAVDAKTPSVEFLVLTPFDLSGAEGFDAVLLPPNLSGARGEKDEELHRWLKQQHSGGATLCSACAGAFWLGHAGLLDGRAVTTHWALEDELKTAFPKARLHADSILIDDHDVVTAGGVMAWIDLGLHLIRRWMGSAIVTQTCKHMLIDPAGREQRTYRSFRPSLGHTDDQIRGLQLWLEANVDAALSVALMAQQAGMSPRSLQRRFRQATGLALSQYVQSLRVEKAKGMLEGTSLPIAQICWNVGYQDVSAFSRLFLAQTGLTAGGYRKKFGIV